jgi:Ankyrin repeats (3 copies)
MPKMSHSYLQHTVRCLTAAGYIVDSASPSEEVDLLHVDPSDALILKHWTGSSFSNKELVTHPVRPNSSATGFRSRDSDCIICIGPSSALHILDYDCDDGEWITRDIPHHRVHDNGKLAAWMGVDGALHVFFQDPSQRLIYFATTWNYTIALPGSPKVGSPIFASAFEGEMYVFYISAMDHRIHYVTIPPDGASSDNIMNRCKIHEDIKQFSVAQNQAHNGFDAYLLVEDALLYISADKKIVLGKVDAAGEFVSERSVDQCCNDAWSGTLTADRLERYLESDRSILDSPGGEQHLTPLAAACASGHPEIVKLILARGADPNALSPQNRTPLFITISYSPPQNRLLIVRTLLDAGAEVDKCYAENDFNTPLMSAIIMSEKDVVDELIKRGASVTAQNAEGLTPQKLAGGRALESVRVLQPPEKTPSQTPSQFQKQLMEFVVALVMMIVTYTNSQDLLGDVLDEILNSMGGFDGITNAA